MFDPTIYDNLKVVFEGGCYDIDADGEVRVVGREDLVDLASMARTFRMTLQKKEGCCTASLTLSSGILDFASELRRMRLADDRPGCTLELHFTLPVELMQHQEGIHAHLQDVWGEVAEIVHEHRRRLTSDEGSYHVTLAFRDKIDEDNIADIEPLLEHFAASLEVLEEFQNSR